MEKLRLTLVGPVKCFPVGHSIHSPSGSHICSDARPLVLSAAATTGATNGHIKVITDRRGAILGATIVGAGAAEIIAAWALAVSQRLNIAAFAGLLLPYPSYSELGKQAAMTCYMPRLTSAWVRRIIGWLRRLG